MQIILEIKQLDSVQFDLKIKLIYEYKEHFLKIKTDFLLSNQNKWFKILKQDLKIRISQF